MTEFRAIPSRHVKAMEPPPGAVERTLTALETLAAQEQGERLFGFLDAPAIRGQWDAQQRAIYIMLDGTQFWTAGWSRARNVALRWTILSRTEDWHDDGWLPDEGWAGINATWRARIWAAIQPVEARRLTIP